MPLKPPEADRALTYRIAQRTRLAFGRFLEAALRGNTDAAKTNRDAWQPLSDATADAQQGGGGAVGR